MGEERRRRDEIRRLLSVGGDGRALEMIDAGFPLHEPYLAKLLAGEASNRNSRLCQGKFRLPESYYLPGVPDPTDSLAPNEVCVVVEGKPQVPRLADGGSADGCVADLIYRAPGCHEGDIRGFTHVPPPRALREMLKGGSSSRQNAIFFSVRGEQAPADKLAGGDYDGDEFMVLGDPELVELMADAPVRVEPAEPAAKPKKLPTSPEARTHQLASLALHRKYTELDVLGKAAFNIAAQSDWYGAGDKTVKALGDIYYGCLDSGKTGAKFSNIDHLCINLFPIHMEGKSQNPHVRYLSWEDAQRQPHLFGKRQIRKQKPLMFSVYEHGKSLEGSHAHGNFMLDDDLRFDEERATQLVGVDGMELKKEVSHWKRLHDEYNEKMRQVMDLSKDPKVSKAKIDEMKKQLKEDYRNRFIAPVMDKYDPALQLVSPLQSPPDSLYCLAQAVYTDVYQKEQAKLNRFKDAPDPPSPALSFAWSVAGDILIKLKKLKRGK